MATLPPVPDRPLPTLRADDTITLARGTVVVRVHRIDPHATTWTGFRREGPTRRGRFDHHPPPPGAHPDHGILYAAGDGPTALLEAFQVTRTINRHRDRPWLAKFRLARGLKVLDLRGPWPTRAGASQALATGDDPAATQAWARAIHADYPGLHGILYPSSMRGTPTDPMPPDVHPLLFGHNLALFERAAAALPTNPILHQPLDHPGLADLLAAIAEAYGYDLI